MLKVSKTTATLYGDIDFKTARNFCNWVKKHEDAEELTLFIDSTGGYNKATKRILNAINSFGGIFTTISSGKCASAAFDIFLAGDRRYSNGSTDFMIHRVVLIVPDSCILTINEMQNFVKQMIEETAETFEYISQNCELTPEFLLSKTESCSDWHFDENTALEYKIITEII